MVLVLVAALAVALVAAGCGGGDGSDGSVSESTEASVNGAEVICAEHAESIAAAVGDYIGLSHLQGALTAEQGRQIAQDIVYSTISQEIEELEDPASPAAGDENASAITASLTESVGQIKQDPNAVFGDKATPFGEAPKVAQAFGLKSCHAE